MESIRAIHQALPPHPVRPISADPLGVQRGAVLPNSPASRVAVIIAQLQAAVENLQADIEEERLKVGVEDGKSDETK